MAIYHFKVESGSLSLRHGNTFDPAQGISNVLLGGHVIKHLLQNELKPAEIVFSNILLFYKKHPLFSLRELKQAGLVVKEKEVEDSYEEKIKKKSLYAYGPLTQILPNQIDKTFSKMAYPHKSRMEKGFFYTLNIDFHSQPDLYWGFYVLIEGENISKIKGEVQVALEEIGLGGYKTIGKGFLKTQLVGEVEEKIFGGPGIVLGDVYCKRLKYAEIYPYNAVTDGPQSSYQLFLYQKGAYFDESDKIIGRHILWKDNNFSTGDWYEGEKTFPARSFVYGVNKNEVQS